MTMAVCQTKQRYDRPPPPPDVQEKLDLCEQETLDMSLREVKCPKCDFVITRVYSDARGHFLSKCPKCKSQYIMNYAYFRRQKGIGKLKQKYYAEESAEKLNKE